MGFKYYVHFLYKRNLESFHVVMPAITATAPGKIILFGEHAVVYGYPAIAVPVSQVRCKCTVHPHIGEDKQIMIEAPDINLFSSFELLDEKHPFVFTINIIAKKFSIKKLPGFRLHLSSTIPVASGMGSSAATSIAIIKAVSSFLGLNLNNEIINNIAFEVEKVQHGTPSGIDNTVITYERPIYFQKNKSLNFLRVGTSLHFIIADSGIKSLTKQVVKEVRSKWLAAKGDIKKIFNQIGNITKEAQQLITDGDLQKIGNAMNCNHLLLKDLGVSCEEIDSLVDASIQAGAIGAKLCGAGKGGNMIALFKENQIQIQNALKKAGAKRIIQTEVKQNENEIY